MYNRENSQKINLNFLNAGIKIESLDSLKLELDLASDLFSDGGFLQRPILGEYFFIFNFHRSTLIQNFLLDFSEF